MDERPRADQAPEPTAELMDVARTFLPGAEAFEPVAGRANLVRARQDGAWWKIRRWPEATTRTRLEFIHRVLDEVNGAEPTVAPQVLAGPDGTGIVLANGALHDAQQWLPGEAVAGGNEVWVRDDRWATLPEAVPDELFSNVVRTVALVHARTERLAEQHPTAGQPLAELITAVNHAWKAQRGVLRPLATVTPAVRRWLAAGERALPAAEAAVAATGDSAARPAVDHFGLWPAHVIVAERPEAGGSGAISGLIGWEHCNTGSPLIDIVQVVSRFRGWSAAGAEMAIAAYGDVSPLRPEERRLLPAVAALDLIATTGQMLIFAYGGRPEGTRPSTAMREAARSLLDSLDVATNALAAQDRPKKPAGDRGRWSSKGPHGERSTQPRRRGRGPQKKR
jgi:hypothetical protein